MDRRLTEAVESLRSGLTPDFIETQVRGLLRQGEDVGGGVNAFRLVKHLLAGAAASDAQVTWAYAQLKAALGAALEQIPSLYYFVGD